MRAADTMRAHRALITRYRPLSPNIILRWRFLMHGVNGKITPITRTPARFQPAVPAFPITATPGPEGAPLLVNAPLTLAYDPIAERWSYPL